MLISREKVWPLAPFQVPLPLSLFDKDSQGRVQTTISGTGYIDQVIFLLGYINVEESVVRFGYVTRP